MQAGSRRRLGAGATGGQDRVLGVTVAVSQSVGFAFCTVFGVCVSSGSWTVARAQMQLQGATIGGAARTSAGGDGSAPSAPLRPTIIKPPGEDTIVGRTLSHDGAGGSMVFDKPGGDLVLSRFASGGSKISAPGKACSIDISPNPPVVARSEGRPAGAFRYAVALEACPFSIDILEGAVIASRASPSCEFTAADCKITPGGLWGPKPDEISPKQAKDLERERVHIETTMRADFRALLKKAGKDKAAVKAIAGEQAGFSSDREVMCRDYAQESVHGFCSTQITEARVLALIAKFELAPDNSARRRARTKP